MTFRTSSGCPNRALDWHAFKRWVKNKYSKTYSLTVYCYALKFHALLDGNLAELQSFSKTKRGTILRALVCLSKYLGVHQQFKQRMKDFGLKWESADNVDSFLRILRSNIEDVVPWVKKCLELFDESYGMFVMYGFLSGMRRSEVLQSFNMVIRLTHAGRLSEYYNAELQTLEHYKYPKTFLRGKKNVFFTFMPNEIIQKVQRCRTVSLSSFKRRRLKHALPAHFNELRDYFATFMVQHGLMQQEVDILQGRIGRSMFMKHYFSPDINSLRERTLQAVNQMLSQISVP